MAVGTSNRIVIEIEPGLKEQIYAALRARGLTLKDWFTQQVVTDLISDGSSANSATTTRHVSSVKTGER